MPTKKSSGGFSKEVAQRLPVGVQSTKVVDTSLAKTISLVGGHAMAAAKGFQHAKLEGNPDQDLPTKEIPATTAAYVPGGGQGNLVSVLEDSEGGVLVDEGAEGGDPFAVPTNKVLDPDVTLSFNQIAKARKQGIFGAEEAESRIEAATRAAINRMPGQASEFRRAAGEFFGKFGPGGSVLRRTDAEQAISAFTKEKTLQDMRDAETSHATGVPVKEIQRLRGRAELAQYNKVVSAEDLARFTAESAVVVTAGMNKIASDAFEHIQEQGNVLTAKSQAAITVSLGAIRNNALLELQRSPGYLSASLADQTAAKDSINKVYDDYQAVFSDLNAAKTMTDMKTELNAAAHIAMANDFPGTFRDVQVLGPELVNKLWELIAKNPELYTAMQTGDVEAIKKREKAILRYPELYHLLESTWKSNRPAYDSIIKDMNTATRDAMEGQNIDKTSPYRGPVLDNVLSVFKDTKVPPGSASSINAGNTLLNHVETGGDYLSMTDLATPAGRAHVRKTPGMLERLSNIIASTLATDFNAIRSARVTREPSAVFDPAGSFDASSGFLGAANRIRQLPEETLRAQLLERTSLTQRLLNTYPEIWNKTHGSAEEFAGAMFDKAKQDEETRRMLFEEQEATEESLTSTPMSEEEANVRVNITELDADLEEVNRLIREKPNG